jgi:DNA-binding XRE family transcriptional regulator
MTQTSVTRLTPPLATLRRAVAANEIVDALETIGYTQKEIAKAAGASDRSVRNWAATGAIRPSFNDRIRELFQVSLLLSDTLTWRGVTQWMSARNMLLDNDRPIDLIARDESERVRGAVEAFLEGYYV